MAIEALRQDVPAWLDGTVYIATNSPANPPLCRYRGYDSDADAVHGECVVTGDTILSSRAEVDVWWPHVGALNYGGYAMILERTPQRQWRRSFAPGKITSYIPNHRLVQQVTGTGAAPPRAAGRNDVLIALWNKDYPDLQTGLARLKEPGNVSVAITPRIILCITDNPNVHEVIYNSEVVADYYLEENEIRVIKEGTLSARLAKALEGEEVSIT